MLVPLLLWLLLLLLLLAVVCRYGDMVAHDLLWEGAQASAGNLAARYV